VVGGRSGLLLPAFHIRACDGQEIQVHTLGGSKEIHALAAEDLTWVDSRRCDCCLNTQKFCWTGHVEAIKVIVVSQLSALNGHRRLQHLERLILPRQVQWAQPVKFR
jgi:hypothetical protein